jgi:hypothetical protein
MKHLIWGWSQGLFWKSEHAAFMHPRGYVESVRNQHLHSGSKANTSIGPQNFISPMQEAAERHYKNQQASFCKGE